MRLFTLLLFSLSVTLHGAKAQTCWSALVDTTICGYELALPSADASQWQYICPPSGNLSISTSADSTLVQFSTCGEYQLLCCDGNGDCQDTLAVTVLDPDRRDLDKQLLVDLSYQDINCPPNVVANCDDPLVEIPLSNEGPPTPQWTFDSESTCSRYEVLTQVGNVINGCLVESVNYTISQNNSTLSDSLLSTIQDLFISIDTDSTVVRNEVLMVIDSLLATAGQACDPIVNDCPSLTDDLCIDSLRMDTIEYHIPVHLGGRWTLANVSDVTLLDSTVFDYQGRTFEIILAPGVGFFGPGNLEVTVNEVSLVAGNIQWRETPTNLDLRLQWDEVWTYDTVSIVRQVAVDTDGDCVACGGNFEFQSFNIPSIPDFPCGPVSIRFPDECECDFEPVDYDITLVNCDPKTWEVLIYSDHTIVDSDGISNINYNGNSATFEYGSNQVYFYLFSNQAGCPADIFEFVDYGMEEVRITLSHAELSCLTPSIVLTAETFGLDNQVVNPATTPTWQSPQGLLSGTTIMIEEPGTYTVSATDIYGCTYESSIAITYNNTINTITESATVCTGNLYNYLGQDYPAGNHTIVLDCMTEVELNIVEETPSITEEVVTICAGTRYTYGGVTYDEGSYDIPIDPSSDCSDIIRLSISSPPSSTLTTSNPLTCDTRSASLSVMADPAATYEWYGPQGNVSTERSLSIDRPGDYTVTVTTTTTDGEICTEILTTTVIDSAYTPSLQAPTELLLNCRAVTDLTFVNTDADTVLLLDVDNNEVMVSPTLPLGTGQYRLIATSGVACAVEQALTVEAAEDIRVSYEIIDACPGETNGGLANVVVSGGVPPYAISIGEDSTWLDNLAPGEHLLRIDQADGCSETRNIQISEVASLPDLTDQTINTCSTAEVTVTLPSDPGITYTWSDGHPSPVRSVTDQSSFDIIVDNGCEEGTTTIYVEPSEEGSPFTLPNVINPNGYVNNRTFLPVQRRPVTDYSLAIYDRFGNKVFASDDPSRSWDGTYRGQPVLVGSYTYALSSMVDDCAEGPQRYSKTGSLLVLR